jgi:hypothetical protein
MKIIFSLLLMLSLGVQAQDLTSERIRKITAKKRSIYFDKGIFLSGNQKVQSKLKAIRHGYKKSNGYERLVFDFTSKKAPKVYGYKAKNEKKVFVDFFNTSLGGAVQSFGKSKLVDKVEFYPVGDESLSAEISLKGNYAVDVFYLNNPGRLVIDIKN